MPGGKKQKYRVVVAAAPVMSKLWVGMVVVRVLGLQVELRQGQGQGRGPKLAQDQAQDHVEG